MMKTIQVVLDEETLSEADRVAAAERLNRSQLVRKALAAYFARAREFALEESHRRGYVEHPVAAGEFDVWDAFLAAEAE
jgi:CopG family transcriptional regulator / antitoxin EndoAI